MKKLLILGQIWPEPESSAAGIRIMQLLNFFLKKNYNITFATTAVKTPNSVNLEELGIKSAKIELNNPSFDHFAENLMPDIVLFDRFMIEEQFGWRIIKSCHNAIKILDTEDLHFLRKAREEAHKKGIKAENLFFESEWAKREIASIYRCDLSLIISETEINILTGKFKIDEKLLLYLPFLLDKVSKEDINEFPDFEERQHFLSLGNFLHQPNWNMVLHLKEKIWPLIRRKLPEAEMHIYGAYPSKKVHDLHKPGIGFMVKGKAGNAKEVMKKARVCLAPIQFGAGLKGKLIQAMQSGTPSVTTAMGAEGIAGNFKWNGFIENEPEAFAQAAIELYTNKTIWTESCFKGIEIINNRFSEPIFTALFYRKIINIEKHLKEYRKQNFIGAMLHHHQHRSTYFLSKYIEIKNKI